MTSSPRHLNPNAPPFIPAKFHHLSPPPSPSPASNGEQKCKPVRTAMIPVPTGPRNRGKARVSVKPRGNSGGYDGGRRLFKKRENVCREVLEMNVNDKSTSVMIRNIPNNYTRKLLVEFLEEHCKKVNEKAGNVVTSAFDFVYLPVDFKHRLNAGYAFVNFTTSEAAWMFHLSVTGKSWPMFQSKKIADVTRAKIQGKEALVKNFVEMRLFSPSEEYLPVWFDPPLDGSVSSSSTTSKMHPIGAIRVKKEARCINM